MDPPSVQPKNKEKVGEKRPRNEIEDISDTECAPLVRRSSRSKGNKPPPIPASEGPGKHAKPSTRSIVPVRDEGQEVGVLPKLLFRREDIPPDGRLNIASKPNLICKVKKAIIGTDEWDTLLGSPFGKLFNIPTALSATSGKIIHQIICRMLVTMKKHELWFVFGGKPMRFGLTEFANVTGLNCGPLPPPAKVKQMKDTPKGAKPYWNTLLGPLFGPKKPLNVSDVSDLLVAESKNRAGRYLSGEVRLALSLLVLIDGVIAPNQSGCKVRDETCEMLKDIPAVLSYPWGRESFNNTIRMLILGEEIKSVDEFRQKLLMQSHVSVHGFPLTIQLVAFKAIPRLHSLLPKNKQTTELIDPDVENVGYMRTIRTEGITNLEDSPNLIVHPYIEFGFDLVNHDLSWNDERQDPRVDNMVQRIQKGQKFERIHWQVWGEKVLRNLSPTKQAGGGQTPKSKTTKAAGSSRTSQEGPSERYVGEELISVPPINWGNPDETVPGLLKWLEDEQQVDLAQRIKWWDGQRDSDLAERKQWWSSFGERLVASYCSYHSEKPEEKGEQVDGERVKKGKNLDSDVMDEKVDEPEEKGKEETYQSVEIDLEQRSEPKEGATAGEGDGNKDDDNSRMTQDVDWERLEAEMTQVQQSRGMELGYVTPPRQMEVDLAIVEKDLVTPPGQKYDDLAIVETDFHPTNPLGPTAVESSTASSTEDDDAVKGIDKHVETTIRDEDPTAYESVNVRAPESQLQQVVQSEHITLLKEMATEPMDEGENLRTSGDHVERVAEQPVNTEQGTEGIRGQGTEEFVPVNPAQGTEGIRGQGSEEFVPVATTKELDDNTGARENYILDNPVLSDDDEEEPIGDLLQPGGEDDDSFQKEDSEQTENRGEMSAPTKKRDRRKPKRLVEETSGKKPARGKKKLAKAFLSILKNDDGSEYTVNNLQVTKKFFEQLYTPSNHVANEHIEAVLSVIWIRHGESLLAERVAILDTLFTAAVVEDYRYFKKLRSAKEQSQFAWNKVIQRYVRGDVEGRGQGLAWITEVDEVYMPMYWQKNHWVAISINLRTGWVHIMDSNIAYTKNAKVKEAMMPLLTSLPHILRAYVDHKKCKYDIPQEFVYDRLAETPQNPRSGDCGLLSVRFIELLSQNLEMEEMDEAAIDKMRMSYAIQVFECFVKPLVPKTL